MRSNTVNNYYALRKFLISSILCILVSCSDSYNKRSPASFESYKQLKFISLAIDLTQFEVSVDNLSPEIVSADKVFGAMLHDRYIVEANLIPYHYRENVPPENPNGNNAVEKWGSGFNSWAMNSEEWSNAKSFLWKMPPNDWGKCITLNIEGTDNFLFFPILWDKKPELIQNTVNVLMDGQPKRILTLSVDSFHKYMAAAKEWLEPEKVSIGELEERIRNGCENEREFSIRMLGRKADSMGRELIESYLEKDFSAAAKEAAFWALGEIGDKSSIPFLIRCFYRDNWETVNIVEAICKIGGGQVEKELKDWLSDPEMSKREKRDIIRGIGKARYTPGRELIEPFLQSPDKEIKEAAKEALENLEEK